MNREKAYEILKDYIHDDGGLYCMGHYMSWTPGNKEITLDCGFTAEELSAISWWMSNATDNRRQSDSSVGCDVCRREVCGCDEGKHDPDRGIS